MLAGSCKRLEGHCLLDGKIAGLPEAGVDIQGVSLPPDAVDIPLAVNLAAGLVNAGLRVKFKVIDFRGFPIDKKILKTDGLV